MRRHPRRSRERQRVSEGLFEQGVGIRYIYGKEEDGEREKTKT